MKRTKAGSAMRCDADRLPGRKRVTFNIEEPMDTKRSPDSFVYCIHCKEHVHSPDPGFNSHMICRVFLAAGLKDGRKYSTLVYNLQNGILKRPDVQKCFYWLRDPNGGDGALNPTDYESEKRKTKTGKEATDYMPGVCHTRHR